jgi:hypothetical protein
MVLYRNYSKNKVIDFYEQNKRAKWYFYYINSIIQYVLAEEDIISLNTARSVLHSTTFMYKGLTKFMSDVNATRMVQLSMNLAVIAWQFVFATTSTWFSYYMTSPSGLKKVYQCIFTNPLYGLLFYGTFYLKLIGGTSDEKKFDHIASVLGLPKHADMGVDKTLSKIINYVPEIITGDDVTGYKLVAKNLLKSIASSIAAVGSQTTISKILIGSLKQANPNISKIENPAVYISDRDRFDFDDKDIQDQIKFLKDEHKNINKFVKKYINPKDKQLKKRMFMEIAQVKTPAGHVICLNKCAHRVKTHMGCYCEGDCSRTTFLGGKKWCWVDPEKCKNGKYLKTFKGYAYDECDNTKLSKTKKCFTGQKYTDCDTK